MLITPHAVLGASIAAKIQNPFLVLSISFFSHYFLDLIPHWQETLYPYIPTKKTVIRTFFDLLISFVIVFFIAKDSKMPWLIWSAGVIANIPDLDTLISLNKKCLKFTPFKTYYNFHLKIQRETGSLLGILPQLFIVLLSLLFVFG